MKLVDTTVLLHAVNRSATQHRGAARWLTAALNASEGVGFAWLGLVGFLRLSTRSGIMPTPLAVDEALALVSAWLAQPTAQVLQASPRHGPVLGRLLIGAGTAGNLTNDAHLAAIAIEHGATLVSFDRDFERFAGLSFELLR